MSSLRAFAVCRGAADRGSVTLRMLLTLIEAATTNGC
jgi:hypothetical protein